VLESAGISRVAGSFRRNPLIATSNRFLSSPFEVKVAQIEGMSSTRLPQFLRDVLSAPPRHGEGVHSWLYRVSRQLHVHREAEQIFALLRAVLSDCGRQVPDLEIWNAIHNSEPVAWRPGDVGRAGRLGERTWPAVDLMLKARALESGWSLYDLFECSPLRFGDGDSHAEEILPVLFPNNPLICVGVKKNRAITAPLNDIAGEFGSLQFIVPSPMSRLHGINQHGKESARCLDSTGPRKYLIVEFDYGTLDEQAALLAHLAQKGPLALVVFSGSKSLHGWFAVQARDEQFLRRWMVYAVKLGADPANFTRCQFARMPDGTRDNGRRQTTYFFNPEVLRG
jgi:hypothetical protein